MLRKLVGMTSVLVWAASTAIACGFHTYVPQPTMIDRLLVSDHIVLARADPDSPFRFKAIAALEGPLAEVELPHLVDSATRRRFEADPAAQVLFARDGAYGPWQRIAYIDDEMRVVLDHVIPSLPEWGGIGDDRGRYEYFAGLLGNSDPRIARLALRELDQASYRVLRSLEISISAEDIVARLDILSEMDLVPIRILLLGMTDAPETEALLRAGFDRNLGSGATARLGAFSTAWLEHSGSRAAQVMAGEYLTDPELPLATREMIIEALAIHSEVRDPDVAEAVRQALASAVRVEPALVPAVARQFGIRNDWSLSAPISEALRSNKLGSVTDILLASQYVALADEANQTVEN